MKSRALGLLMGSSLLLILPACDLFNTKKSDTSHDMSASADSTSAATAATSSLQSDVLMTIDGKPAITVAQYEAYLDDVIKMQPQLKQVLTMMPRAERELCQNYQIEVVVEHWIAKNGIDKSAAYQEDLQRAMNLVKRQLSLKYYQEEYPKRAHFDVTDDQARAWYDENKENVPPLVISRGGINAQMITFDKADDAQAFYNKVKGAGANFDSVAKELKLTVKTLKDVGACLPYLCSY